MAAEPARVGAALAMLSQLGVSVADLNNPASVNLAPAPTVAQHLPRVIAAASRGATRTYGSYWVRMALVWADRPLDTIAATDVEALQRECAESARSRRNGRGGRHAGEHVNAAARALFTRAIADGLIPSSASPAHQIVEPRRLPSTRRALTPHELTEINERARTSGNDVVLDALLLRLHTEAASRRGGALALRLKDLDTANGLVRLREKGETVRWQPITSTLPVISPSMRVNAAPYCRRTRCCDTEAVGR